jgi:hypothetical protein
MVTGHSSSWRDLDFYFLSVFQLHQKYVIAAWRFSLSQPWLLRCSPEIVQREFQRRAVREAVAGAVVRIDPLIVVGLDARAGIKVEEIAFHLSGRRHGRLPDATVSPGATTATIIQWREAAEDYEVTCRAGFRRDLKSRSNA